MISSQIQMKNSVNQRKDQKHLADTPVVTQHLAFILPTVVEPLDGTVGTDHATRSPSKRSPRGQPPGRSRQSGSSGTDQPVVAAEQHGAR